MTALQNTYILVILNDPLTYWCDYAFQTVQFLTQKNKVVVFCSENVISWKNIFGYGNHMPFFEKKWNALLFHPFFIIPGQRFQVIKQLNYNINAFFLHVYIFLDQPTMKKIFWFFDPFYIVSLIKFFPKYISVYDCVDYYEGISHKLHTDNRLLLARSTYVFANSHSLVNKLRPHRSTISLVPLGFAQEVFQKANKSTTRSKPIVAGFVGGITRRIDYSFLTSVAKKFPEIQFVFYGTRRADVRMSNGKLYSDIAAFFKLKNVFWKGSIAKEEVPSAISSFDICLIPYTRDLFNKYCFPMKVMEYFYMGKPVLATPIDELKRFPKFVYIGETPEEWEYHIWRLLSKPWPAQFQTKQRKIAEKNSWEQKLTRMERVIR